MGNDVVILMTIFIFLVGLGAISPLLQEATNSQYTQFDTTFIINTTLQTTNLPSEDFLGTSHWYDNSWAIITNIFKAIFWQFDWFPWWLTIFHWVLRFILVVVLYRLIRSGSG